MDTMEETTEEKSVRVTRVVARPLDSVWEVLMKPHGAEALLGEGGQLGSKGEDWRAADGTYGVTRSFHPKEQIRFSWHASDGAPRTLVLKVPALKGHRGRRSPRPGRVAQELGRRRGPSTSSMPTVEPSGQ